MEEIRIINDLNKEVEKRLVDMHSMLTELIRLKKTPLSENWLSSKEMRLELGISPRCEQNWLKKGILKSTRIEGKRYYSAAAIHELLEKNITGPDQQ